MQNYIKSLVDPFDTTLDQPKLYDGSEDRSSGLRFRNSGNISLPTDGSPYYLALCPSFTITIQAGFGGNIFGGTAAHPNHYTEDFRSNIKKIRLVSAGLKLNLLNSSDQNEGTWEAIRIPFSTMDDWTLSPEVGYADMPSNLLVSDMSNHHTYQTGNLRDLHRFQFKLNSTAPDHPFTHVPPGSTSFAVEHTTDTNFDIVLIKLQGRVDATPSLLRFMTISNQEVLYKEDTVMSKLATNNILVKDMNILLDKTRYKLPAVQIS